MVTLGGKLAKENEIKIDAAEQMFSSFSSLKIRFFSFLEVDDVVSFFEIIDKKLKLNFYVSAPKQDY